MNIINHSLLKIAILTHSKPELAELPGSVYQIWDDGEVTMQKSGELLWNRILHTISPPICEPLPIDYYPNSRYGHGFIYTDKAGIDAILAIME